METPEDRFYNPARINAWFGVSALLVFAGCVAAILADHYDREWKGYQKAFHDMEEARAREALALRTADPASLPRGALAVRDRLLGAGEPAGGADPFKEAVAGVRNDPDFAAGAALAARALLEEAAALRTPDLLAEQARILAVRRTAEDARFKAEKEQRELQALVDQLKFEMDHARSHGHDHEASEKEARWKRTVAAEAEVHARMDGHAREKTAANDSLKALLSPATLREDRARTLLEASGVAGAERKLASMIARGLRDAPLLDPFAPVLRIEQKVFPELTVDYNFAHIQRVDRCMTCHTGIDKVRVDPGTGEVIPLFTAENTPEKVFRTHPRPELFVSSVSKHSLDKVGCTVCHDGLGWGLSFNDAYHTPDTPEQEKEWKEKYHWHRGESWTFPMLPKRHIEASCAQCHRDPATTAPADAFAKEIPSAPKWNRGQRLVEEKGCFGCHKLDGYSVPGLDKWLAEVREPGLREEALATSMRKTGPSLERVASKWTSEDAAWKWIWNPQALRPTTNMPRFFGQPNNRGVDPLTGVDYDLRTRTEVWGLVAYLWDAAEPYAPESPPVPGDAARGAKLFGGPETVGCVACHSTKDFPNPVEGGRPNGFGPDLSTVGSKTSEAWLYTWARDPAHYWEGSVMPSLRLTEQEGADIAAYLASLRDPAWEAERPAPANEAMVKDLALEAARVLAKPGQDPAALVAAASPRERLRMVGQRAMTRYSCFGCHAVKGFEKADRIGTQLGGNEGWGSKDVDRLDFGLLKDPKAVKTFADWGTKLLPHRAPEWARMKLLNPRVFDAGLTKQPHEKLVMPDFHFTEDEAEAVVTYLLSLRVGEIHPSKRPVRGPEEVAAEKMRWLVRQYNCYGCHTVTPQEVVAADGSRRTEPRGGDIRPWLGENKDFWPPTLGGEGPVGEGAKVRPAWLFDFLRDPGRDVLRFWLHARMPSFRYTEAELNALVHGFAAADRVPFPFEVEKAKDLTEAERTEVRAFFNELECAKCHPTKGAAGQGPAPSGLAPDLVYSRERLRFDWVRLWLDDPARLQPGTKMPAFWRPGEGEFEAPSGLSRPYFGNDPHRQIRNLADYVFDLGRNRAAAEPPGPR